MELSFDMFPILSALIVLVLMILKLFRQSKPKLPPGPWKLPIIGSIHHLSGSLPHNFLKDLADKHGPLMHLQLGELSLFVVSSLEIAKEVMKTHDSNFADRPFHLAASILFSKQVQSLRVVRQEGVSKFIKAFGKKCKEQDAFISLVNDSVMVGGGFSLSDLFPSSKLLAFLSSTRAELEKIHQGFDRILNDIIEEHKISENSEGEVEKDLVDILLHVQKHGDLDIPLSTDNIKAVILQK
ncbi:cytochrome P450 71D11 [Artemisia annua]|uniref:Cytochrome P450 71D11 n=1 Tax=Artemisia annua TaxID=35608 RepID=A0A2U1N4H0_ARTAN|nr:cytochrome P450 71D11 [Artemisia annua]